MERGNEKTKGKDGKALIGFRGFFKNVNRFLNKPLIIWQKVLCFQRNIIITGFE